MGGHFGVFTELFGRLIEAGYHSASGGENRRLLATAGC